MVPYIRDCLLSLTQHDALEVHLCYSTQQPWISFHYMQYFLKKKKPKKPFLMHKFVLNLDWPLQGAQPWREPVSWRTNKGTIRTGILLKERQIPASFPGHGPQKSRNSLEGQGWQQRMRFGSLVAQADDTGFSFCLFLFSCWAEIFMIYLFIFKIKMC